jgi:hypothetical protein
MQSISLSPAPARAPAVPAPEIAAEASAPASPGSPEQVNTFGALVEALIGDGAEATSGTGGGARSGSFAASVSAPAPPREPAADEASDDPPVLRVDLVVPLLTLSVGPDASRPSQGPARTEVEADREVPASGEPVRTGVAPTGQTSGVSTPQTALDVALPDLPEAADAELAPLTFRRDAGESQAPEDVDTAAAVAGVTADDGAPTVADGSRGAGSLPIVTAGPAESPATADAAVTPVTEGMMGVLPEMAGAESPSRGDSTGRRMERVSRGAGSDGPTRRPLGTPHRQPPDGMANPEQGGQPAALPSSAPFEGRHAVEEGTGSEISMSGGLPLPATRSPRAPERHMAPLHQDTGGGADTDAQAERFSMSFASPEFQTRPGTLLKAPDATRPVEATPQRTDVPSAPIPVVTDVGPTVSAFSSGADSERPSPQIAQATPEIGPFSGDPHQQIVRAVRLQWQQGVGDARLTLRPEHLGEVTIRLRVENGTVTAVLRADTAAAADWIRNNQNDLQSALQSQGLDLRSLEVVVDPDRRRRHAPRPEEVMPRPRKRTADAPRFEVLA